jgi:hypothetical protein
MFLPRNFNVCDDHVISLEPVKRDWLSVQVFLTNIEGSHTNRQCFYLRLSTLVASDGIWAESKRADVESLIRVTNSDLLVVDQNS